jgi:hypothetical protein
MLCGANINHVPGSKRKGADVLDESEKILDVNVCCPLGDDFKMTFSALIGIREDSLQQAHSLLTTCPKLKQLESFIPRDVRNGCYNK